MVSRLHTFITILNLYNAYSQRWSRGPKARGQGKGHTKNPRPRTALLRKNILDVKDRNARGQAKDEGHNSEVISRKIIRSSLQNFVNFPEISSVFREIKCLQNFFRKLSGVLQNETKLVMILAHF